MNGKPPIVIDGDGHVVEVNPTYDTIEEEYYHRRPLYTQRSAGDIVRLVDGKIYGSDPESGFVGPNGNSGPPIGKAYHYRRAGTYNPWARLPLSLIHI